MSKSSTRSPKARPDASGVRRARARRDGRRQGKPRSGAARTGNTRRVPRVPTAAESAPTPKAERRPMREPPRWLGRARGVAMRGGLAMLVAYGLLLGAREVYEYATTSARFEVRSLIYEPTKHVSDDDVRALMALEPGTNVLALDLDALTEAIASHPWVATAKVTRHLPDTVEVEIEEHEAAAVVLAGHFYLVDADGRPFKRAERGERGQLPIITGVSRSELADDRAAAVTKIGSAIDVLELYAQKKRPRVGELHLDEDGGVTLYTQQTGTQLRFGRREVAPGLERFDALRAALGTRADGLAVVHLDSAATTDRRERVVARFYDERDEHAVLADAAVVRHQKNSEDADKSAVRGAASRSAKAKAAAAKPQAPAANENPNTPKKRRIPRYQ